MRLLLTCALVVCTSSVAFSIDPIDELFADWAAAQGTLQSLVVDFDLVSRDLICAGVQEKSSGSFRLVRTNKSEVFASYAVKQDDSKTNNSSWASGLLNNGKIYLLNHSQKKAFRFEFADGEVRPFLEENFNPLAVLLDRQRADTKCNMEVGQQDENFIYLAIKPKQVKKSGWFRTDYFVQGRVVVTRKDLLSVPKGMPRELSYTDGSNEYRYDIKAWRLNSPDGPKLEEFARPEDRPGWEVISGPAQNKK